MVMEKTAGLWREEKHTQSYVSNEEKISYRSSSLLHCDKSLILWHRINGFFVMDLSRLCYWKIKYVQTHYLGELV